MPLVIGIAMLFKPNIFLKLLIDFVRNNRDANQTPHGPINGNRDLLNKAWGINDEELSKMPTSNQALLMRLMGGVLLGVGIYLLMF